MKKRPLWFLILKLIILQFFFYLTVTFGPQGYGGYFLISGFILMILNYYFIKDIINLKPYLFLILIFFGTGFVQDTLLIYFNLLNLNSAFPPIWIPTLWMMYLGYYGDIFKRMLDFPIWLMSLLGAIGGSLAYYRGISALDAKTHEYFYLIIAINWAIFQPLTLLYFRHFRNKKLV